MSRGWEVTHDYLGSPKGDSTIGQGHRDPRLSSGDSKGTGEFPLWATHWSRWVRLGELNRKRGVWQSSAPSPHGPVETPWSLPAITWGKGPEDLLEHLLDSEAL